MTTATGAAARMFNRVALTGAIAAVLACESPVHAQTSSTQGQLLRDEATFQLALTMKVRADQYFLLGDRARARSLYEQATGEMKVLAPGWAEEHEALLALLFTDIAYRQALLRYDADFWGATYSLTPINPVEAYIRFADTVNDLDELVKRIKAEQVTLATTAALADSWRAAATGASTDSEAQSLQQVAEEIKSNHHAAKATAAQDRIDANRERQKGIAAERVQLAAQYDAAHKQFDAMVVNAALQAAGIPPELQQLSDADKPLEERILAAGRAAVAGDGAILNSFAKFSETTAAVVDAARSIDKALTEIERLDGIRKSSKAAVSALRRGTLEGALEAGQIVYAQLPAEQQSKLKAYVVDKSKPAMALFDRAHAFKHTMDVVVNVVKNDKAMLDNFKSVIAERAFDNAPALDTWYRKQLTEAAKVSDVVGTTRALMEQAVRGWPRAFFAKLPEDMRTELRLALNVTDDAQAASRVFSSWPPDGDLKLDVSGDEIEVRIGQKLGKVNLRAFLEAQQEFSLEALQDYAEDAAARGTAAARLAVQQELGTMVAAAMGAHEDLANRVLGSVHTLDAAAALSRLVPQTANGSPDPAASAQLFDKVWHQLPQQAREAAAGDLAVVQAGSMVAKEVLAAPQRRPAGNPAASGGSPAGKAEEAILKAAVAAAFPAAGAALMAVDALEALGQMNSLADRINALTAEDRRIMTEQITLFDLVRDERAAAVLAELGGRIADTRRVGALEQAKRYRMAADRLDDSAIKTIGAQRLYLPRAFLLAEQLRFHFDRLDRSLAFWTGDPRAPRGQLARELASDPQWLRYALDPSIQLFNWLDRTGESDRGELQRLAAEWQQKLSLATAVCGKLQCLKTNAVVGEVTATSELSLKASFPDQWQRFLEWKTSGTGEFTFELLVTPALLKPDKRMHNIRFVAARVGVERAGNVQGVHGVKLEHSGAAYVPYDGTFVKEHYVPRTAYGISWTSFGNMRARWQKTLSLMPLEGYGVYTLWRLAVPDSTESRQADDVKLQFNVQFRDRTVVPDDRRLVAEEARKKAWSVIFKTADNLSITLPLSELPFFGSEQMARAAITSIANEPEAAKIGLGGLTLQEKKGGSQ